MQDFATIHSILRGCGGFDPYLSGFWSHSKLPGWFVVTSLCSFAKSNAKLSKAVALFESSRDYFLNEWIISKAGRDFGLQSARSWIVSNNIQKEMTSNSLVNKRDATWGKTHRSCCRFKGRETMQRWKSHENPKARLSYAGCGCVWSGCGLGRDCEAWIENWTSQMFQEQRQQSYRFKEVLRQNLGMKLWHVILIYFGCSDMTFLNGQLQGGVP